MTKKTMKSKMKLGVGGRFKKLTKSIEKKSGYGEKRAKAIAAAIGRKKLGAAKFQKLAAAGKKRASSKK